ncbi:MAG: putative glycoside hydrolase [Steroidobacteraceae bacterium]
MSQHPIRRFCAVLTAVAALALCASAFAFTPPPFPRLAGIETGGQANYNSTSYQDALAKLSVVILKYWPGLTPGGESMQSIINAIHAKNPNTLVFFYTESDEGPASGGGAMAPLYNEIRAMDWWLKVGSSLVPSFYGNGTDTINNTPYTPKNSSGYDSIDWITHWYVNNYYKPNPAVNGFFMDNVFAKPRVTGDWYDNGTALLPSNSKAAAALQAGYERWFTLTHQLMSGKYQIGNAGSWAMPGATVPAGYVNMTNGATLEALIGASYSTESWAGWSAMMKEYDAVVSVTSAPKLVVFNQWGSATDYQSMRYGLASCLMNNGYYSFTSNASGYYGVVWFDEYNAKLGAAVGAPPTSAWQKGVWRRDFIDGIALVNPKGNGPQTVSLGGTFVKLKGTQAPGVNNGQTVTQVTLQNRDGIILMRKTPLVQPASPGQVTVGTG